MCMTHEPLRSARLQGDPRASHEDLPGHTRVAIVSLLNSFVNRNWLASEFPSHSEDWSVYYVSGTDYEALYDRATGLIKGLGRPWDARDLPDDDQIFDLVEFCGRYVHKPSPNTRRRDELRLDRGEGVREFYITVNELLRAGGSVYALNGALKIVRVIEPEVAETLNALSPATGDNTLDGYIQRAREGITARSAAARSSALQELWAAFDYLKTSAVPGRNNKIRSIEALLANIESDEMRDVVSDDMKALRAAGNSFRIRHHETDAVDLTESDKVYFAGRMANLLLMLLRTSDRLERP